MPNRTHPFLLRRGLWGGQVKLGRALAHEIGADLPLSIVPVNPSELREVHPRLTIEQVRFKLAIRALRYHLGLGQRKFGERLGLTRGSASTLVPKWESPKKINLPGLGHVQEIQRELEKWEKEAEG